MGVLILVHFQKFSRSLVCLLSLPVSFDPLMDLLELYDAQRIIGFRMKGY